MNIPNKSQIFQLFRSCIRYSDQLKLSDKKFVSRRIKGEFHKNKTLSNPEEICRAYEVVFKRSVMPIHCDIPIDS